MNDVLVCYCIVVNTSHINSNIPDDFFSGFLCLENVTRVATCSYQ